MANLGDHSEAFSRPFELILERFENEWISGSTPDIDSFLLDDSVDSAVLLMPLIEIDIELRLKQNIPLRSDRYAQLVRELIDGQESLVKLKELEFSSRCRWQNNFDRQQFLKEHPEIAGARQLQLNTVTADKLSQNTAIDSRGRAVRSIPQGSEESKFGPYILLEAIGFGGMGTVYRALQENLGRIVAVKVLSGGCLAGEIERKRFRAEANTVAGLNHPGIVSAFDKGEQNGSLYYAMEFVDGQDLASRISNEGQLPIREVAKCILDASHAISYAHGRQVIHRDIKPANIIIDLDNRTRVVDFGLARYLDEAHVLTRKHDFLGTLAYMAPESISQGGGTILADIYSLGATLYHCLTGKLPFGGDSIIDTQNKILKGKLRPPRELRPEIDPNLNLITMRCLNRNPALRYQTAEELANDLERFLSGEAISNARFSFSPKRRLLLATACVVAIGLGIWASTLSSLSTEKATAFPDVVRTSLPNIDNTKENTRRTITDAFERQPKVALLKTWKPPQQGSGNAFDFVDDGNGLLIASRDGSVAFEATRGESRAADRNVFETSTDGISCDNARGLAWTFGVNYPLSNRVSSLRVHRLKHDPANGSITGLGKGLNVEVRDDIDSGLLTFLSVASPQKDVNIHCGDNAKIAWSADYRSMFSVGGTSLIPNVLKIWDIKYEQGSVVLNLEQQIPLTMGPCANVVASRSGNEVALRDANGNVLIWQKREQWQQIDYALSDIKQLFFTDSQKEVFQLGMDGAISKTLVETGQSTRCQNEFCFSHAQYLSNRDAVIALGRENSSTDGEYETSYVCLLDPDSMDVLASSMIPNVANLKEIDRMIVSQRGSNFALLVHGEVFVFECQLESRVNAEDNLLGVLQGWNRPTMSPVFSPTGATFSVASVDPLRAVCEFDTLLMQPYLTIPNLRSKGIRHVGYLSKDLRIINDGCEYSAVCGPGQNQLKLVHSEPNDEVLGAPDMAVSVSNMFGAIMGQVSPSVSRLSIFEIHGSKPRRIEQIEISSNDACSVAFSPCGKFLLHAGWNDRIVVRTLDDHFQTVVHEYQMDVDDRHKEKSHVVDLEFSKDGSKIACSRFRGVDILEFDAGNLRLLSSLEQSSDWTEGMTFDNGGTWLAVAGESETIKFFDVHSWQEIATYSGHRGKITGLDVSGDDAVLISTSEDKTVRVWATPSTSR